MAVPVAGAHLSLAKTAARHCRFVRLFTCFFLQDLAHELANLFPHG